MAEKELIIKLGMDRSKADQAGRAFTAAEKGRIAELISDTQAAELAKAAIVEKANKAKIDSIIRASLTEEQRIGKALTDVQAAESAKAALVEKANKAKVDAILRAALTEEERIGKVLSGTEAAERAKAAIVDRTNKAKVDAIVKASMTEEERIGRLLSSTEVAERAKAAAIEQSNKARVDAAVRASMTEEQRIGKVLSESDAAERAKAAMVDKANKAKVDAILRASMTEEERIGKVLSATEVAERVKAAAVERTNKEKVDAAIRASMTEEQLLTKVLTKEQVAFQVRDNLIRKHNAARVDAQTKALAAAEAEKAGWGGTADGVQTAIKAVTSFAGQMIGLQGIQSVVGTIVEGFKEAQKSAYDAGQMVQDYRESLLELAALKGMFGNTGEALKEDIAFRAQTLQTRAAAKTFQSTALGVGESAIDNQFGERNISRKEFTRAMILGGSFQAIEGGDAKAHATLVGLLPTLSPGRKTGEEIFTKEKQLFNIFQPGGAEFSPLATQYAKLAPLIKSGVYSEMKAAALLSGFSTTNMESPGENVMQFTRATLGGIGRKGLPRVEGAEAVGKFFKEKLGIDDEFVKKTKADELAFKIGDKVSDWLVQQEKEAKARGEEFNAVVALTHEGFMNQEDRLAMIQYHGLKTSGQLAGTFMPLAEAAARPTVKAATDEMAQKQQDPTLQRRKADLAQEASKIAVGAGQEEYIANLYKTTHAKLFAEKKVTGEFHEGLMNRWSTDPREIMWGYRHMLDEEAQRLVEEEATKAGVQFQRSYRVDARTGGRTEEFMGREKLFDLAMKVKAVGGESLPGLKETTALADKQLETVNKFDKAVNKLVDAVQPKTPPPVQGRPVVQNR